MSKYPQVLFQNRQPDRIATLEEYRRSGGYQSVEEFIGKRPPAEVTARIDEAGLRGRGGAGFPAAKKWLAVPADGAYPRYLVVNSDEMEPGTFKDRMLTHADPHLIIEGMILAAYAISASKAFVFVRPSYESSAAILEREVERARQAGYLGRNILGSEFSFDISVHRSGGRYICGEGIGAPQCAHGQTAQPGQTAAVSHRKRPVGASHGGQQHRNPGQRPAHPEEWR